MINHFQKIVKNKERTNKQTYKAPLFILFPCGSNQGQDVALSVCFIFFCFVRTLSSPSRGRTYRCLCPGLYQCSLAFPACVQMMVRVTLAPFASSAPLQGVAAVAACGQRSAANPFPSARLWAPYITSQIMLSGRVLSQKRHKFT